MLSGAHRLGNTGERGGRRGTQEAARLTGKQKNWQQGRTARKAQGNLLGPPLPGTTWGGRDDRGRCPGDRRRQSWTKAILSTCSHPSNLLLLVTLRSPPPGRHDTGATLPCPVCSPGPAGPAPRMTLLFCPWGPSCLGSRLTIGEEARQIEDLPPQHIGPNGGGHRLMTHLDKQLHVEQRVAERCHARAQRHEKSLGGRGVVPGAQAPGPAVHPAGGGLCRRPRVARVCTVRGRRIASPSLDPRRRSAASSRSRSGSRHPRGTAASPGRHFRVRSPHGAGRRGHPPSRDGRAPRP